MRTARLPAEKSRSAIESSEVPLFSSFNTSFQFLGADPVEYRRQSFVQCRRGNQRSSLVGRVPSKNRTKQKKYPPSDALPQLSVPPPDVKKVSDDARWFDAMGTWKPFQSSPPVGRGALGVFVGSLPPLAFCKPEPPHQHILDEMEGIGEGEGEALGSTSPDTASVVDHVALQGGGGGAGSPLSSAVGSQRSVMHWVRRPLREEKSRRRTLQFHEVPCEFPIICPAIVA